MSTLVYHHDGLDRVLRGFDFLVSAFRRADEPSRRGGMPGRAAVAARPGAAVSIAAKQHEPAKAGSAWSNWRSAWERRRAERDFEEALLSDPRMQIEWEAIKTHREWHS